MRGLDSMFNDRQILEYLQDLVYKDLANHFTGNPQSIVSADDLKFRSLSPDEVQMRKKILMNISELMTDLGEKNIKNNSTPSNSFHTRQTYGKYSNHLHKIPLYGCVEIVKCIQGGRKIEAIKNIRSYTGLGLKDAKDIIDYYLPNDYSQDHGFRDNAAQKFLNDSGGGHK